MQQGRRRFVQHVVVASAGTHLVGCRSGILSSPGAADASRTDGGHQTDGADPNDGGRFADAGQHVAALLSPHVIRAWQERWSDAAYAAAREQIETLVNEHSAERSLWLSTGDGTQWSSHGDCAPISGGHEPRMLSTTARAVMAVASRDEALADEVRRTVLRQTERSGGGFAYGDMHTVDHDHNSTRHPWYIICDGVAQVMAWLRYTVAAWPDLYSDAELAQALDWASGVAHSGHGHHSLYWKMQTSRTSLLGERDPDNMAVRGYLHGGSYARGRRIYLYDAGSGPEQGPELTRQGIFFTNREDGIVDGALSYAIVASWMRRHRPNVQGLRTHGSPEVDAQIIEYAKHYMKERLIYTIDARGGMQEWERGYQSDKLGAGLGASYAHGGYGRLAAMALHLYEALGDEDVLRFETQRGTTVEGGVTAGSPAEHGYTRANGYRKDYTHKSYEWAMVAVADYARGEREAWLYDHFESSDRARHQFRAGPRTDDRWEFSLMTQDLPNDYYRNARIQAGADWLYKQGSIRDGWGRTVQKSRAQFSPAFYFQWTGL